MADGRRDPLDPLPVDRRPTGRELASWRAAAGHLREIGVEPIVPPRVVRAWDRCRVAS